VRQLPFFLAGEYPVDGKLDTLLFVSVLAPSGKRFLTPACQCNAGDTGEGGAKRASDTLLLVTAVEAASGKGGEDASLVMMGFFYICTSLEVRGGVLRQKKGREQNCECTLPVKNCTSHRELHFTCELCNSLITCEILSAVTTAQ
jgi:hypothetical protein